MNIIFLDIDGVLNNDETYILDNVSIDTTNIKCFLDTLDFIKAKKEIKVVISSSWRYPQKKEAFIRYIYDVCGKTNKKCVKKLLTYLHEDYCTVRLTKFGCKRGHEIKEWLSRHKEVEKYLCLDDDSDFFKSQPLLQTFPQYGFRYFDGLIVKKYFIPEEDLGIEFLLQQFPYFKKRLNQRVSFLKKSFPEFINI